MQAASNMQIASQAINIARGLTFLGHHTLLDSLLNPFMSPF